MTHGPWCTGTPCPCQQTICSAIHARCCRTSIATSGYCRTGILHPIYQWHLTIRQHGWPHKVQIPTSRSTAQHPFLAAGFIPWKHPRGWKQDHGSPHALAVAAAITNHSPSGLHTHRRVTQKNAGTYMPLWDSNYFERGWGYIVAWLQVFQDVPSTPSTLCIGTSLASIISCHATSPPHSLKHGSGPKKIRPICPKNKTLQKTL